MSPAKFLSTSKRSQTEADIFASKVEGRRLTLFLGWQRMSKESFPEYKMVKGLIFIVKVVNDFIKWCSIIKMAAVTWGPNDLEVCRVQSTHSDIKSIQALILIFSNPAPSHRRGSPSQTYCQLELLIGRQHCSDLYKFPSLRTWIMEDGMFVFLLHITCRDVLVILEVDVNA